MIEVIKHGKFHKEKMFVICPLCQCEFKYKIDDIYATKVIELTIPTEKRYVLCPECNAEVNIGTLTTTIPLYPYPYYPIPQSPYGGPIVTYCNKEGDNLNEKI